MQKEIRKVEMNAKNTYQLNKLQNLSFYFIPCEIEEEKETIKFTYEMTGLSSLNEIDRSKKELIYSLLIQICELKEIRKEYRFSVHPQNIYFDQHGRVFIQERDIQDSDKWNEDEFLLEIKALAGHLMQKKYSYTDIIQGGIDLLNKSESTKGIYKWESLEQAVESLKNLKIKFCENEKKTICKVNRKKYIFMELALTIMTMVAIVCAGLFVYQYKGELQVKTAALNAERAYLDLNYVETIDSMENIELDQMDEHEKYILAISYIKGQAVDTFSAEAKELILSKITVNGSVAYMEYWIHLGRLETGEAQSIAMQLSDDQLLLYAYIQELDLVSGDLELEATEKVNKISDLEGKIKTLADKLGIEYKEEKDTQIGD